MMSHLQHGQQKWLREYWRGAPKNRNSSNPPSTPFDLTHVITNWQPLSLEFWTIYSMNQYSFCHKFWHTLNGNGRNEEGRTYPGRLGGDTNEGDSQAVAHQHPWAPHFFVSLLPACVESILFLTCKSGTLDCIPFCWCFTFCAHHVSGASIDLRKKTEKEHVQRCAGATKPKCCNGQASLESWDYLKRRIKELGLEKGASPLWRTKADCLRICAKGPIAVIYPDQAEGLYSLGATVLDATKPSRGNLMLIPFFEEIG
eukprot:1140791-Pelagomonas_calceolata.AAC.4